MTAIECSFPVPQPNELPLDIEESPAIYIQKILSERNEFRNQNIQLWNIIQKQRIIIQHQQRILSRYDISNNKFPQYSDSEINDTISEIESSEFNGHRDLKLLNQNKDNSIPLEIKNINHYHTDLLKNEALDLENTSVNEFQKNLKKPNFFRTKTDIVLKEYISEPLEKRDMIIESLKENDVLRSDRAKRYRSKSEGEKPNSKTQTFSNSFILKNNTFPTKAIESKLVEYNIKRNSASVRNITANSKKSPELKLIDSNCEQTIKTKINKIEERKRVIKSSIVQDKESNLTKAVSLVKANALECDSQNDKAESISAENISLKKSCQDIATSREPTLNFIDTPEVIKIEESVTNENTILESSSIQKNVQLESPVADTKLDALENIFILVSGIIPRINLKGKEVVVFRIQVNKLIRNNVPEGKISSELSESIHLLWSIEKLFSDILELDNKLRSSGQLPKNTANKLPDKKAWNTSSPSKLDQYKLMLQNYLQDIIDSRPSVPSIIYDFIVSDQAAEINPESSFGQKEGYLIKRGKNFGKWKKRYFLIKQNILEYFDSKSGTKLGEIQLSHVQIAVQHTSSSEYDIDGSSVDTFRHAFMILEPKKSTSVMCRHVLCADSDIERDDWVRAIGFHLIEDISSEQFQSTENEHTTPTLTESSFSSVSKQITDITEVIPTNPGALEVLTEISDEQENTKDTNSHLSNTNVLNGATDTESNTNELSSKATINRNFKTDRSKSSSLRAAITKGGNKDTEYSKPIRQTIMWGKKIFKGDFGKIKVLQLPVFGVTLQQSVMASRIHKDCALSSVVHRCIQYLDSKEAQNEEGIYRLSGSSATIRQLKMRFDTEGDYNILESEVYYDIHAISGLLKLYIRELPTSVLTPEKQNDFLKLTEYTVRRDRVRELGKLLCSLPIENYTLLRTLINHLITIVKMSDLNKMTLKNVGIVFAPTLGIPAGVFGLLMAEFKYVFFITNDGSAAPQEIPENEELEEINSPSDSRMKSLQDHFEKKSNPIEQTSTISNQDSNPTQEKILNSKQKNVSFVSSSEVSKPRQQLTQAGPISEGTKRKHVRNSYNFFNYAPPEIFPSEKKVENALPNIEDA